jgi:diaminohydroxyphosphoribosylaminopyrimidine deaminase/5-amino-6-(5-phosphoribosylamino)uracil reductase
MNQTDERFFMERCFTLARQGAGKVSPNPMVGCVIVQNGEIVGEGFHRNFGGPHAEVFALRRAGVKAKGAILYVSLEPCAHFGKTPPCTDKIIHSGISQVVLASKDPNPLVRGKGIERLRAAGIPVTIGICRNEAEQLNEKFFTYMKTGLPFVGIKLAQTLDGRIADLKGNSKWVTSETSRKAVHQLRAEFDAVLVGANTVLLDDPELTVRLVNGRNPVRIVVDGRLSLPVAQKIFHTSLAPTWLLTSTKAVKENIRKVHRLIRQGVRVLPISSAYPIECGRILRTLAAEDISSVLVEGGAVTVDRFLTRSLGDTLYLFIAPKIIGGGMNGITLSAPRSIRNPMLLKMKNISFSGEDACIEAKFNHP